MRFFLRITLYFKIIILLIYHLNVISFLQKRSYFSNDNLQLIGLKYIISKGQDNSCDHFEWRPNCAPEGQYMKIQAKTNPYIVGKNVNQFCAGMIQYVIQALDYMYVHCTVLSI